MPSHVLKPLLSGYSTRTGLLRSVASLAAIVICATLTIQAQAQVQVAENTHTAYSIEMVTDSGRAARIEATWMPTALTTRTRTVSFAPSALYSRSIAAWRNSLSSPAASEIFHGPVFLESSQASDSRRDRSPQSFAPHHTRGLFGGAASWILQEAIGDDGIADLKNGCRMAKRVALLRR